MKKETVNKLPVLATLVISLMILNACSSASTDEVSDAESEASAPAETTAQVGATDVVPDDHNPELELAVAAGAVIVNGTSPTAENKTDAALDNPVVTQVPEPKLDVSAPTADTVATVQDTTNLVAAPDAASTVTMQAVTTPSATDMTTTAAPDVSAPVAPDMSTPVAVQDTVATTDPKISKPSTASRNVAQASDASTPGTQTYTVKKGDTLMKIAFEQFGDLYRWREIYSLNQDQLADPNHIPPGTKLHFADNGRMPSSVVEHVGESYLIQQGDTLAKISNHVYGTFEKWKKLWENNKQLIHDPNKIYTGFYLYYVPDTKVTSKEKAAEVDAGV